MAKGKGKGAVGKGLAYIITYLIPFVTGILVLLINEDKDKRLKYHALQAVFYGIAMMVLYLIAAAIFLPGAQLLLFILWLYGLYVGYQAYMGEDISIAVIGDYAMKYSKQ